MKTLIVIVLLSNFVYSKNIEIYFFSTKEIVSLIDKFQNSYFVAENILKLQCQKMGEYCFDPQVGLYKEGQEDKAVYLKEEYSNKKVNRRFHENIFLNQKVKEVFSQKEMFELWIDTSNILKTKDVLIEEKSCKRSEFLSFLKHNCSVDKKFKLIGLSNIKKELSSVSDSCQIEDNNISIDKLLKWIKESKSKNIQIFLDEYYANGKLLSFLNTNQDIKVYGIDKAIYLNQMDNEILKLKKFCK